MSLGEPKLEAYVPKLRAVLAYALAQNPVELAVVRSLKARIRAAETPKPEKTPNFKTIGKM